MNRISIQAVEFAKFRLACKSIFVFALFVVYAIQLPAQTIYDDALNVDFQNYSWGTTVVDFGNTAPVHSGAFSIAVTHNGAYDGFYLNGPEGFVVSANDEIRFQIHGGAGGQTVRIIVADSEGDFLELDSFTLQPGVWQEKIVSLEELGEPFELGGFVLQEGNGGPAATYYVDSIEVGNFTSPQPPGTIYDDVLNTNFQNFSFGTTVDFDNTTPVHTGASSIAVTHNDAFTGLYLNRPEGFEVSANDEIRFQIHGGVGGQTIQIFAVDQHGEFLHSETFTLQPGVWQEKIVNIDEVGEPYELGGFVLLEGSGGPAATYYVDSIEVGDFVSDQGPATTAGPSVTVDAATTIRAISDEVYGLNFADPAFAQEIGLKINRWGGNATSRYDHTIDTTNLASDFFFENMPLAPGQSSTQFLLDTFAAGSDAIVTIGMLDYMPKSTDVIGAYRVSVYGEQENVNMYRPDHGNGIRLDGSRITNNDPSDTSIESDESFAVGWITDMVNQFGDASQGGVKYYALGNEPMLWNWTHMDVHSGGASYDEVLEKGIRYGSAIKQADPTAKILGPVLWGWVGFFYSGLDAEPGGEWWLNPLDRNAHGGTPFLEWYLQEMAAHEAATGQRLLDYLDLHFYPQSEPVLFFTGAGDLAKQQQRIESTRQLWDSTYVDESYINDVVQLIPRMHDWVDTYYPGTKLALTEYNYGAHDHVNGAVALADALGIFGREGLDIATVWEPPTPQEPGAYAFRMFRNYDGNQNSDSRFGNNSLAAVSADPGQVSAFAARRNSDNAVTLMLINKSLDYKTTPLTITGMDSATAEVFVYGRLDRDQIRKLPNVSFSGGTTSVTLEPYSITMIEIEDIVGGEFVPDSLAVFRGIQLGGELSDLFDSDNHRMRFLPGFTLNTNEAPVWLVVDGTLSGPTNQLTFAAETRANTPGLESTIEVWNWSQNTYQVVSTESESFNTDSIHSVDLSGQISNVVQNGQVRSRIGWRRVGFTILYPWEVRVDHVIWQTN